MITNFIEGFTCSGLWYFFGFITAFVLVVGFGAFIIGLIAYAVSDKNERKP